MFRIINTCKRSLGHGNVFTRLSAYKGGLHPGGSASRGGRGSASGDGGVADPPGTRKAGATHLTGMLSCYKLNIFKI